MSIAALYSPIERAVLSAYLRVPDPTPADLAGIDITKPVSRRWSETRRGIDPRESELGHNTLMLENAVARICLESINDELPQWAVVREGSVALARPRRRASKRRRRLNALRLFTINWGDSGPGFSWPEAYYVTGLTGYDVAIVTASADSPDTHGYCDFAIGWFDGRSVDPERASNCIAAHWATQKGYCQERWEYLFETGAIDVVAASKLADTVWPTEGEEQ